MEGTIIGFAEGPQFFDYHAGSELTHDTAAEFATGSFVSTEMDGTGQFVELTGVPIPLDWWDTTWRARRCFDVANSGPALTEQQVRVEFDTTADITAGLVQPNGEDYRAIAADNTTQLELWAEGPMNDAASAVWVQLDIPAGGTSFCLYYANPAATSVSSQAAVFSYTTPRQLYYTLNSRYNGSAGVNGQLDIVSFVDNNVVNVDGNVQTLQAGDTHTFANVTANSVILVTGPIAGRGAGNGTDALVPISFAGTDMLFPTNRQTNQFVLVAPFATGTPANVTIYNGAGTVAWSGTVGSTAVVANADITGSNSGIIESDAPILVTHIANNSWDATTVPPIFPGEDLYGVRSTRSMVGVASGPASADGYLSNGTIQMLTGLTPGVVSQTNGGANQGQGPAIRFTNMTALTGVLQQADSDGGESTAFLPERLLENEYFLPSAAQYVTFACPTTMTLMVGATTVPCVSPGAGYPGKGYLRPAGGVPAGTRIYSTSGEPFFAAYEHTVYNDEANLFGMKSALANPNVDITGTPTLHEELALSGTWTSPVLDTLATGSNVFGLLTSSSTVPAGTTLRFRVASGATALAAAAAPFLGPDGTAATFWTADAPLPYAFDFTDQFLVVRAYLDSTTLGVSPQLDSLTVAYDLPEVSSNPSGHAVVTAGAAADTDWIVRVWAPDAEFAGATAIVNHVSTAGTTGASAEQLGTEAGDQVIVAGGVVTQTSGTPFAVGPGLAHSISVDTTNMVGATQTVRWEAQLAGTGILVHHELQLVFS